MKLPILAATVFAAILLASSSLALAQAPYGVYNPEATQSVSPQADQPYRAQLKKEDSYKAPMPGEDVDHKAGKGEDHKAGEAATDHKAGGSHKAGYPPYVRFYPHLGHGYYRHGRFYHYHR